MSGKPQHISPPREVLILAILALLFGIPAMFVAGNWQAEQAHNRLEQRSNQVLALHKEAIFGLLDKYSLMTVLVARRPGTREMFVNYQTEGEFENLEILQSFAGHLAAMSGAYRVRLALPSGKIIAQSTLESISGVFLDNGLRDTALQDRLGRATLVTPERLSQEFPTRPANETSIYAFAASVRHQGKIIGIINIDVGLELLENAWALSEDLIFVTNSAGNFIVGNQLAGLLGAETSKSYNSEIEMITTMIPGKSQTFLARGEGFPHIGWTLNVLINEAPVLRARATAMIITGLIALLLLGLGFILIQRRLAYQTRIEAERKTANLLEQKVEQRTAELLGSNVKLQKEFDERVAAETALKKAQDSLIQSAKLAAIGQMSTALAHEYNQPLAAIRSYADNAVTFLGQEKPKDAEDNLHRIAKMTERMAHLSRTLKTFAREPRTKLQPVVLQPLLREAIILVEPSAKKHNVDLHLAETNPQICVMAGYVRLSQVVVNLLSNAIDAVADGEQRDVFLSAKLEGAKVSICVQDTGPGVAKANKRKIFDAFFTSKDVGDGLGLGLSIAYNIVHDFGGEISVGKSEHGGAAFVIVMPGTLEKAQTEEGTDSNG